MLVRFIGPIPHPSFSLLSPMFRPLPHASQRWRVVSGSQMECVTIPFHPPLILLLSTATSCHPAARVLPAYLPGLAACFTCSFFLVEVGLPHNLLSYISRSASQIYCLSSTMEEIMEERQMLVPFSVLEYFPRSPHTRKETAKRKEREVPLQEPASAGGGR